MAVQIPGIYILALADDEPRGEKLTSRNMGRQDVKQKSEGTTDCMPAPREQAGHTSLERTALLKLDLL
jgi:hypothetical protein